MHYGSLEYYCLGEIVTCILPLILCCNIFISFTFYDRRHRLFMYGGVSSFIATFVNVFAVYCISYYRILPLWLGTTASTVYCLFLCMIPYVLSSYASDIAHAYKEKTPVINSINGIVYTIYVIIVFLNIKTGWIFRYTKDMGYVRGPLKNITYVMTLYYSLTTVIMIIQNRRSIARRVFAVFTIYPFICVGLVFVQFIEPKIIMTGTASFAALFFAYITIQSDMIDYDVVTGLMTENKLRKQISLKSSYGYIYMLSIENMNLLQASVSVSQMNELFLNLGRQLTKCFERSSFRIASNRLVGICKDEESLRQNARIMAEYISSLNANMEGILPASLEVYTAAIQFSKDEVVYANIIEILSNMIFKSKAKGLRQLQICDEAILVDMDRKRYIYKILKNELRLDSEQFQVWFQPIYSLKEKRFTYMEALSRLKNTDIGDIMPAEFVQIAESKGLIEKLGNVAFEKVCKFISENRNLVQAVSINFSVYQMMNPNLVQNVLGTIGRFGLQPSNIIMEITESIFIDNFDLVRKNMIQLAVAGIKFYLDDFGTGYSNLANVIGLEFSTIKIDRSLVLKMEESSKAENLISNLIGTFKDADLSILVEGVETNNQNDLVIKAGADYIQGFLYSRPLPPDECIELLKHQKEKANIILEED